MTTLHLTTFLTSHSQKISFLFNIEKNLVSIGAKKNRQIGLAHRKSRHVVISQIFFGKNTFRGPSLFGLPEFKVKGTLELILP